MEEAVAADSGEAVESTPEVESTESFDMEGAVNALSEDIFGKSDEPANEPKAEAEEKPETEEKPVEKPVEKAEKTEEKAEEKDEKPVPTKEAPQSWKKEYREFFNSADPALQDYILTREDQMHEGIEKDRSDANLGRTMRDIMTPHEAFLKQQGLEPVKAMQSLLNVHYNLSQGTPEQKAAALQRVAQSYRIGEVQGDPRLAATEQKLAQIEQNLNASHERAQQATRERIDAEVADFAKDHPLFDDLEDDIASLIRVGNDLESAYEKAVWSTLR